MCKINPRVDFAFKLIFGNEENKDILLSLLNSILEDYQDSPIKEIKLLNPYNQKEFEKDKLTILDIKAKSEKGEYYNIEVQIADQYYYRMRALYYWARLYSSQIGKSGKFWDLKRTVCINILNFEALKEQEKYHNVYRMKEVTDNSELTNLQEIHFIELEKFTKDLPELKRTLDRWIYFLKYAENYTEKTLPEPLKKYGPIEKASKIMDRISLNDEERLLYDSRLKIFRDEEGAIETARLKGKIEGKIEGKKEEKNSIARKLLSLNINMKQIVEATGLSKEEIEKL